MVYSVKTEAGRVGEKAVCHRRGIGQRQEFFIGPERPDLFNDSFQVGPDNSVVVPGPGIQGNISGSLIFCPIERESQKKTGIPEGVFRDGVFLPDLPAQRELVLFS